MECYRLGRREEFAPRPAGTWSLIHKIKELVEHGVAMRKLIDVVLNANTFDGKLDGAIDEFRKWQRFTGELDDGGDKYAEAAPEVAENMRAAARQLQELASFWERDRDGQVERDLADALSATTKEST